MDTLDWVIVEFELDAAGNRINTSIPLAKPRLYRSDGWWVCESPERTDYGSTPQWAYHFWQFWTNLKRLGHRTP